MTTTKKKPTKFGVAVRILDVLAVGKSVILSNGMVITPDDEMPIRSQCDFTQWICPEREGACTCKQYAASLKKLTATIEGIGTKFRLYEDDAAEIGAPDLIYKSSSSECAHAVSEILWDNKIWNNCIRI